MYQRCFDNASETLFVAGKTPRLSRFAFSDDPKWESGHHVHDNETELIYVKKGVARFTIDSSLYVAHADDIVVIERGGNDSNLLIVFYVQIMPDDFVMQLHRF